MTDTFTIDTGPVTGLAADLEKTGTRLADADFLRDAAAEVARLAAPRTPRATGRLAGSLSLRPQTSEGRDAVGVRWGVGYAVFVNFGTRTMRARPFATDALAAAEGTVEKLAVTWLNKTVEAT